ncbi:MAG TPA: SUMF1/EgtB/PvdO family nonheme iron enzyme, partial [Candidatus Obscuribacterales bacterium]
EAEFEYAARGGLDGKLYPWGDELRPGGKWYANLWQGEFPVHNSAEDGFAGTSPVGYYRANGYGLYDMAGNVWQWCSDWYRDDYYRSLAGNAFIRDPQGPDTSFDPLEPGQKKRVLRGGSHLCTDQYCARYIVGSRGKAEVTSSSSNIGFRCARDDAVR